MRANAVVILGSLAGGLVLGWVTVSSIQPARLAPLSLGGSLVHSGREILAARQELERSVGAPPDEATATPPPPDVAVLFRRDLTAIEQRSDGMTAWIVDYTQPYGRRSLRRGDSYREGWRISAIEPQMIELRRRQQIKRIAVFDLPTEVNQ